MPDQKLPEGVNPDYAVLVDGIYYDLCVGAGCKKNTGVRTDCPVQQRSHYVRESGQLCEECSHKVDLEG